VGVIEMRSLLRPLFVRYADPTRPMTQQEYTRFLTAWRIYSLVWWIVLLSAAFLPEIPVWVRWLMGAILALVTPAGGQFTSYEKYLEEDWPQYDVSKHVEDRPGNPSA
jgi:hypothetical protein